MKALSVKNPYASLIVRGSKTIDVRSQKTNYRGSILICSSLTEQLTTCYPIPEEIKPTVYGGYRGYAIGTVNIVDCRPFEKGDETAAFVKYKPGMWAWVLTEPKCIIPFKVRGQLGLFNVNYGQVTEAHVKNLGFELVNQFNHDQYNTNRYALGPLIMDFTYEADQLETCDLTIEEINGMEIDPDRLKTLVEILATAE